MEGCAHREENRATDKQREREKNIVNDLEKAVDANRKQAIKSDKELIEYIIKDKSRFQEMKACLIIKEGLSLSTPHKKKR